MLRSDNKKLYNITNYILKNTRNPILFNPFGIHYKIDSNIIYNKDLEESINKQSGYIVKNIILQKRYSIYYPSFLYKNNYLYNPLLYDFMWKIKSINSYEIFIENKKYKSKINPVDDKDIIKHVLYDINEFKYFEYKDLDTHDRV
mgnify:CR=1 FL=1